MTKNATPAPSVLLPADAAALADCIALSVETKTVKADAAALRFFTVPETALRYPIIGKATAADTVPALAPAVPAYNRKARDLNLPAVRIKGANRWAGVMASALGLLAEKNPDAAARAVALGLLAPESAD